MSIERSCSGDAMRLTALEAHAACAALVAADLVARAWRIQWILRGLGHRTGFVEAFTLNAFGDVACAVTPMRAGGEPARLGGMLRAGVPAAAGVIAIGLEVLAAWPVTILAAGWMAWRHAPAWWAEAGPQLKAGLAGAWPWVTAVAAVSAVAWWVARRGGGGAPKVRRPLRRALVYLRRMPACRWTHQSLSIIQSETGSCRWRTRLPAIQQALAGTP